MSAGGCRSEAPLSATAHSPTITGMIQAATFASNQKDLVAVAQVLDTVFGMEAPASMIRVGFLFDFVRCGAPVLLAGSPDAPLGTAVAIRGPEHLELTHMAVMAENQNQGIGRSMFRVLTSWATNQGFDEVRWCVAPQNISAVAAYLAWGARMVDWIDDAYGVAADAFHGGGTPRFRGVWRREPWPELREISTIAHGDDDALRTALRNRAHVVSSTPAGYVVAAAES